MDARSSPLQFSSADDCLCGLRAFAEVFPVPTSEMYGFAQLGHLRQCSPIQYSFNEKVDRMQLNNKDGEC